MATIFCNNDADGDYEIKCKLF